MKVVANKFRQGPQWIQAARRQTIVLNAVSDQASNMNFSEMEPPASSHRSGLPTSGNVVADHDNLRDLHAFRDVEFAAVP